VGKEPASSCAPQNTAEPVIVPSMTPVPSPLPDGEILISHVPVTVGVMKEVTRQKLPKLTTLDVVDIIVPAPKTVISVAVPAVVFITHPPKTPPLASQIAG